MSFCSIQCSSVSPKPGTGGIKPRDVFYDVNKRSSTSIKRRNSLTYDDECYCFSPRITFIANKERWKKSLKFLFFFCCHHNGYISSLKRLFLCRLNNAEWKTISSFPTSTGMWNKHWSIKHHENERRILPVIVPKWFIISVWLPSAWDWINSRNDSSLARSRLVLEK